MLPCVLTALLALFTALPAQAAAYTHKMRIQFTGYTGSEPLTNFPALLIFTNGMTNVIYSDGTTTFDYAQFASANGWDLRFAASNETTALNYEIEKWNTGGSSYVWVQVPILADSNTCIWAYWGNTNYSVTNAPATYTTNGATWDSSYVAVYHFNDTSGLLALDSTSNRNHGTRMNGVTTNAPGIVDGAYSFDRSQTQYIDCGTNSSLNLTNNFTISMWLKRTGPSTDWERLVGKKTAWAAGGIDIYMGGNGTYDLGFMVHGNPSYVRGAVNPPFSTNIWHPVAMTLQDGGTTAMIYLDGVRCDNSGSIPQPLTNNPTVPLLIGAYSNGTEGVSESYNGPIDEARFEVAVRSSNWLWASYMSMALNTTFTTYGAVASSRVGTLLIIR